MNTFLRSKLKYITETQPFSERKACLPMLKTPVSAICKFQITFKALYFQKRTILFFHRKRGKELKEQKTKLTYGEAQHDQNPYLDFFKGK